jgi:hypothetical protein
MQTRSKRTMPSKIANKRWTQTEERQMVRLRRHGGLTFEEIANELHRAPDAVKLRFEKMLLEHATGDVQEREVLRWFNLDVE